MLERHLLHLHCAWNMDNGVNRLFLSLASNLVLHLLLMQGILTSMRNAGDKSCFPFQRIKHGPSWLHLMQIQIFICELNHFSGLHTKHLIFINKDMPIIHWWTVAQANLNPIGHLSWFASMGLSMMAGIKMEMWSLCHCHFHWEAHYPSITESDSTLDEHLYSI